jgi:hypothetical protein
MYMKGGKSVKEQQSRQEAEAERAERQRINKRMAEWFGIA